MPRRLNVSMRMRWLVAVSLLVPIAVPAETDGTLRFDDVPRVVVIGDVHGAYTALVGLLRATGLVGDDLEWIGGTTHLVSVGDLIDRGPGSRRVLDLMMSLETDARRHGGRVHVVLGNHEVMNLTGDWRYVTPADYAAFAADETAAERDRAFAGYVAAQPADADSSALRAEFDDAYPAGFFARVSAFAPGGRYGAWLLSLPTAIVINGTAYVHGGLSALVGRTTLEQLNARTHDELVRYLALRDTLEAAGVLPAGIMQSDRALAAAARAGAEGDLATKLDEFVRLADSADLGLDGPFWYRGLEYCRPLFERPILAGALDALGATRVIVGHTPTDDRAVQSAYDGRLVMVDTGMLASYYDGRPAALVEDPDGEYVQLLADGRRTAVEARARSETNGMPRDAVAGVLADGQVSVTDRPEGMPWRVSVRRGNAALEGLFYPKRSDGRADHELAAAALDAWLGTELMPPTVEREIEGSDGALQLRYADGLTETERLARRVGFSGWCPIDPQVALMQAFDLLTMNRSRSRDNIVYHNDMSQLMLVGFADAFGTTRSLPPGIDPSTLMLPASLVERLGSLDEETATNLLGEKLRRGEIRALLARRDALLDGRR